MKNFKNISSLKNLMYTVIFLLFGCATVLPYVDYKTIPESNPLSIDGLWVRESVIWTFNGETKKLKSGADELTLSIRRGVAYIDSSSDPLLVAGGVFFKDLKKVGERKFQGLFVRDLLYATFKNDTKSVEIDVLSQTRIRTIHSNGSVRVTYVKKELDSPQWFLTDNFPAKSSPVMAPLPSVTTVNATESASHNSRFESYQALVIGNGSYHANPLANPTHDADAIATSLRKFGFNVIHKDNMTLKEMERTLDRFYASLGKRSVGLFYYAGHGIQINGHNYLVPVDASLQSASDTKYECLDAGKVLDKMGDVKNSLNIVILDACRNNPFVQNFRSASRGLARMDAPAGSIISYATAPGRVASDGTGHHSVYTKYLLRYMNTPGLNIYDIFLHTRKDVVQETNGQQIPWESSSLTDYFYFIPSN